MERDAVIAEFDCEGSHFTCSLTGKVASEVLVTDEAHGTYCKAWVQLDHPAVSPQQQIEETLRRRERMAAFRPEG